VPSDISRQSLLLLLCTSYMTVQYVFCMILHDKHVCTRYKTTFQ